MRNQNCIVSFIMVVLFTQIGFSQAYNWTWMNDSDWPGQSGQYTSNQFPGSRTDAATWTSDDGQLWLFGGFSITTVFARMNDLWRFNPDTQEWLFVKGDTAVNQNGVYGLQGFPGVLNNPGARTGAQTWIDSAGNLWLFGGFGFDETSISWNYLNDLWKYNPSTNQWTWVGGASVVNQNGVYGTQAVSNSSNLPGARAKATTWVDADGAFWLFGGYGYPNAGASGTLGDFWRYDPASDEWTWMKGTDTLIQYGTYGTLGSPSFSNVPGCRESATAWTGSGGKLWLFGGFGRGSSTQGFLNDLWSYNVNTNQWTWESGTSNTNVNGIYGTLGTASASNDPGSRRSSAAFVDGNYLWLFGGYGNSASTSFSRLNDSWRYNITTGEWTWMKGSNASNSNGNYGTMGNESASNVPGSRESCAFWTDTSGKFWILGGTGYPNSGSAGYLNDLWRFDEGSNNWTWIDGDSAAFQGSTYEQAYPGGRRWFSTWTDTAGMMWLFGGNGISGSHNDLWKYDPTINQWSFVGGSTGYNQQGTYGTQGVSAPTNNPGARSHAANWTDNEGNFWLLGGLGRDASGSAGYLNDLWKYNPATNEWTWMKGSDTKNQSGTYGSMGNTSSSNKPGARNEANTWVDTAGNLWLMGGYAYWASGPSGAYNDLWKYDISTNQWTWVNGSNSTNPSYSYGSQGVASATNNPGCRENAATWADNSGNLWLHGGYRHPNGVLSDLWKYDISTGQWTWMRGHWNPGHPGYFGPPGIEDSGIYPGSRDDAVAWTDTAGNFWLFSGYGYDDHNSYGELNDLWKFDPSTNNWTFIKGDTIAEESGVYGTQFVADPANKPGSRTGAGGWARNDNTLWLFGGAGFGSGFGQGLLRDLWRLEPVQCDVSISFTSQTNVSCYGENDGSLTISQSNGTGPYTYYWSNGDTLADTSIIASTLDSLVAGMYTVTVEDALGCRVIDSATIDQPANLSASFPSPTNILCNGGSNGAATVSAAGGTMPYTYAWPGGGTGVSMSGLSAGTYLVTVTDDNGCTTVPTLIMSEPYALVGSVASQTNVSCNGGSDGAITISVNGGTSGYTYAWNGGGNSVTKSGLSAGIQTVTITDANGCTSALSSTITEPTVLAATIGSQTNVSCHYYSDGSATVSVTGGVSPYSYSWAGGGSSTTKNSLNAGSYTVTVTDANGCSDTAMAVISQPDELSLAITKVGVSCYGGSDGSATAIVSGGTPSYTYAWSAGGSGMTNNTLSAGSHSVTVTDANGCMKIALFVISQPSALVSSIIGQTNVSCNGGNDGSITAIGANGTPGYTYSWSGGGVGATNTSLSAGTHTVTVTDANGCTSTSSATLTEPSALNSSITSQSNVSCNGGSDGSATASASGGTFGYSYSWSSGGSTASTSGLSAGTYTVTVTDGNGCTSQSNVIITEPTLLTSSITSQSNVSCNGGSNGSATVTATGGTSGYSYIWSGGGGSSSTATSLSAGQHTVTVTDANGCTSTSTTTITEPPVLDLDFDPTQPICQYDDNGEIDALVNGGVSPYSYQWSTSASTSVLSGLSEGVYSVTVTDDNGCTISSNETLIAESHLEVSIDSLSDLLCHNDSSGYVSALAENGVAPYTYTWSNSINASAQAVQAGSYSITVTDALGCLDEDSAMVTQPDVLTGTITTIDEICLGQGNGEAEIEVTGGTAPYTYLWNDSSMQTSAFAADLFGGWYQVTVMDMNGCLYTDSAEIMDGNPYPMPDLGMDTIIESGSPITLEAGDYFSYLWQDGATSSSIEVTSTGVYYVLVADSAGCEGTDTIQVTIWPTGVASTYKKEFRVFPNPTRGRVTIEGNIQKDEEVSIVIRNAVGEIVQRSYWSTHIGTFRFDLSNQASGVYMVGMIGDSWNHEFRIIKQ